MNRKQQSMEHPHLPCSWDVGENGALAVRPDNGTLGLSGLLGSVQIDGAMVSLADAGVDTCRALDERGRRRITTAFSMTPNRSASSAGVAGT